MSNILKLLSSTILSVLLFNSCTAVNQARTVGKGRTGLEVSFGGPILTNLGFPIPVPNLYLGGRYGLRNDLDVGAHLNVFTPVMPGVALDLLTNLSWVPIQPGIGFQSSTSNRGLGAGLGLDVQWLTDFKNGLVVLPAIDPCVSYRYKWISVFGGSGFGFDFYRPEKDDDILQICPFLGLEFITKRELSIGMKFTAYDVLYNYNGSNVKWVYFNQNSAERVKRAPFGIAIGLGYTLKKR